MEVSQVGAISNANPGAVLAANNQIKLTFLIFWLGKKQKMKHHTVLFIMLICLQLVPEIVQGQNKEMLIEQVADRRIVRKNFDKNGDLRDKQKFIIGELKRVGETYKINVVTELYDENGQIGETYSTTYECNPNELDVLLNVFPLTEPDNEKIKVNVISEDFKQLYFFQNGNALKDIHLKMSIESGVLSFFGSKSLITLKNRKVGRKKDVGSTSVKISSKAVVKAYMLGLKIKTINYSVEEYLTENLVLQRQQFTKDDGAYFTMEYDDRGLNLTQ